MHLGRQILRFVNHHGANTLGKHVSCASVVFSSAPFSMLCANSANAANNPRQHQSSRKGCPTCFKPGIIIGDVQKYLCFHIFSCLLHESGICFKPWNGTAIIDYVKGPWITKPVKRGRHTSMFKKLQLFLDSRLCTTHTYHCYTFLSYYTCLPSCRNFDKSKQHWPQGFKVTLCRIEWLQPRWVRQFAPPAASGWCQPKFAFLQMGRFRFTNIWR